MRLRAFVLIVFVLGTTSLIGFLRWLHQPPDFPWADWDLSGPPRTVVVSHYNEDLSYLHHIPPAAYHVHVYTRNPPSTLFPLHIHFHVIPNHGHEALAYVSYMVDFYTHLPDKVLFLHGHSESWHQKLHIVHLLQRVVWQQPTPYCVITQTPPPNSETDTWVSLYDKKFASSLHVWSVLFPNETLPSYLEFYGCAQFAATRAALQRLDLNQWRTLYHYLLTNTALDDKHKAIGLERLWKYLLTRSAHLQPEHDRCWWSRTE
jgi:hypothetical protein